ncbi:MAG: aminotransferase class V-fold PLP-dependent enzyme [Bacillota bacterium]
MNDNYRDLIKNIDIPIPLPEGKLVKPINFDNAATTPPLKTVVEEINNFIPWYSSIHRGKGYKSVYSSSEYEKARTVIADFLNFNLKEKTIIFVKNTTEAINKLSWRLKNNNDYQIIISTRMEHHSNDLPWRNKFQTEYVEVDPAGRLMLRELTRKLKKHRNKKKLVTVTGISNVTGYINPVHKIARLAHKYNAEIMVDGAQLIPHLPLELKSPQHPEHIDYLAFSAHKMYAPFGTGVLIGPRQTFSKGIPEYPGGGTVKVVTDDRIIWEEPPHKEEAGTPNIIGVFALARAIKKLQSIGMKKIAKQEKALTTYAIKNLQKIPDLIIYGDSYNIQDRAGIIPINIKNINHEILATILSEERGIAVRNGCFCAQPYVQRILKIPRDEIMKHLHNPDLTHPGLVRISFGLYNTFEEIDILIKKLYDIAHNKESYLLKYKNKCNL